MNRRSSAGFAPAAAARTPSNAVGPGGLDPLLLALDELLAIESSDAIIRRAIELARDRIGLVPVSIYVLDRCQHLMLGTWGSDSSGAILDEHHVMYAASGLDPAAFRPDLEGVPYTVFEACLIVEHRSRQTEVASPGWVTCTPIGCGENVIGMMFNDAGPSYAAFDETKQAKAAILCSVLGAALGSLTRARNARTRRWPLHRTVMAAVAMLAQDPGVDVRQIARQLGVGSRRLTRLFEATLGVALGEYRNRMRLDRVALLIAKGHTSLPDAAIAAGFASYAQFEQISRMFRWKALLERLSREGRPSHRGEGEGP
jgi:AraC-like DNA-binding protein